MHVLGCDHERIARRKRRLPRQHLIAGHPQRIDVAAAIEVLSLDLFRTHVKRRSHRCAGTRDINPFLRIKASATGRNRRPSPPPCASEQNVPGLDVAMEDSLLAGPLRRIRHLPQDAENEWYFHGPFATMYSLRLIPSTYSITR